MINVRRPLNFCRQCSSLESRQTYCSVRYVVAIVALTSYVVTSSVMPHPEITSLVRIPPVAFSSPNVNTTFWLIVSKYARHMQVLTVVEINNKIVKQKNKKSLRGIELHSIRCKKLVQEKTNLRIRACHTCA